jgi:hypothetical protein
MSPLRICSDGTLGGFRQDPRGELLGRHLEREEAHHAAIDRALLPSVGSGRFR